MGGEIVRNALRELGGNLKETLNQLKAKVDPERKYFSYSGKKGRNSWHKLDGLTVVWKEKSSEESIPALALAQAEKSGGQDFIIPDKEFYTSEDIVNLTGQPKTLILPRISAEIKRDKTLNPWKVKGDARNRFTKEDLDKLLKAVGSPKKKEHKNGIQKKRKNSRLE